MELPEIIGSTILLFSSIIILLITISYVLYKLKNQSGLQPGLSKVNAMPPKPKQIKVKELGKNQLSNPVFSSVDDRVQFGQSKVASRFEIVNDKLKIKNKSSEEHRFN